MVSTLHESKKSLFQFPKVVYTVNALILGAAEGIFFLWFYTTPMFSGFGGLAAPFMFVIGLYGIPILQIIFNLVTGLILAGIQAFKIPSETQRDTCKTFFRSGLYLFAFLLIIALCTWNWVSFFIRGDNTPVVFVLVLLGVALVLWSEATPATSSTDSPPPTKE
jgi:hypothetical protein